MEMWPSRMVACACVCWQHVQPMFPVLVVGFSCLLHTLAHESCCAWQVVQIFQGEIVPSGAAELTVLPSHLWLYADGTFGVIFDSWEYNE